MCGMKNTLSDFSFQPDLWLPETLIIEVKSVQNIPKEHEVMLVNYLTATKINDGLLINFGPSVQVKRKFREYKPKGSLIDALMRPNLRISTSRALIVETSE